MSIKKHRGGYRLDYRDALNVRQRLQFPTRSAAEDHARLNAPTRSQRRRVAGVDPNVTVATWGAHWLAQVRPTLQPRTADAYATALDRFINPKFGSLPVRLLRRSMIRSFLGECRTAGGVTGGPLAPNSVRLIYSPLRSMLALAVDEELLAANPAQALGGRHGLRLQPTTRQRRQRIAARVLAPETLERLLYFTATDRSERAWLPLLLTYADAGLRLGEAVALEVADFDPVAQDGGTLHVRQQLDQRTGRRFGPPKNGPRVVELRASPRLVDVLVGHLEDLRTRAATVGAPVRWLFPSENWTTPVQPRNVERTLTRLARKTGLDRLSPHDLRHTYGTLLTNAGVSPVYLQRQLGHASIQLTIDTYAATAAPRLPAALVGVLGRALAPARARPAGPAPGSTGTSGPPPGPGPSAPRRAGAAPGNPPNPTGLDSGPGGSGHKLGTRTGETG